MKLFGNIVKWLGISLYVACAAIIVMFLMPVGGWKALNVLTGSMKPIIQPGTLVLIHHVPLRDLKPGDIITYQSPRNFKETITHRIVKITKVGGVSTVTVKGDANPTPDKPFPAGLIVGRVALIVPGAGKFINWLHNPYGLAALVIIPGIIVIWSEVRRLQKVLAQPKPTVQEQAAPRMPPPAPQPSQGEKAPARPRRSLDGMRRVSMLILLPAMLLLAIGHTYALGSLGRVSLTHNRFAASHAVVQVLPASKDDCKNNGWKAFKNVDGSLMFKNQGQCIAFVNARAHGQPGINHVQ